jgi:hypothetical protein
VRLCLWYINRIQTYGETIYMLHRPIQTYGEAIFMVHWAYTDLPWEYVYGTSTVYRPTVRLCLRYIDHIQTYGEIIVIVHRPYTDLPWDCLWFIDRIQTHLEIMFIVQYYSAFYKMYGEDVSVYSWFNMWHSRYVGTPLIIYTNHMFSYSLVGK